MNIRPMRGESDRYEELKLPFPYFAVAPKNFLKELDKDGGV